MKKIVILLFSLVLMVSGCSIKNISEKSISKNIDTILSDKNKLYNVNFDGYKYYVPRGLKFLDKKQYNAFSFSNFLKVFPPFLIFNLRVFLLLPFAI